MTMDQTITVDAKKTMGTGRASKLLALTRTVSRDFRLIDLSLKFETLVYMILRRVHVHI